MTATTDDEGPAIIRIDEDALTSQIAEGMHTAFRKAGETWHSDQIWKLIRQMPSGEWRRICTWLANGIAMNFTEPQIDGGLAEDWLRFPDGWKWGDLPSWLVIGYEEGHGVVLAARRTEDLATDAASPDAYPGWDKLLVAEFSEVVG